MSQFNGKTTTPIEMGTVQIDAGWWRHLDGDAGTAAVPTDGVDLLHLNTAQLDKRQTTKTRTGDLPPESTLVCSSYFAITLL